MYYLLNYLFLLFSFSMVSCMEPQAADLNLEEKFKAESKGKEKIDEVASQKSHVLKSLNGSLEQSPVFRLNHSIDQLNLLLLLIAERQQIPEGQQHEKKFEITIKSLDPLLVKQLIKSATPEIKQYIALIKKFIAENASLLIKKALRKKVIFAGSPGIGKSKLCMAIAEEHGIPYVFVSASSLANEYKNSGIANLDRLFTFLFKQLEQHKLIILILDELSGLTDRYQNTYNSDIGMVEHFLTLLDKCENANLLIFVTINNVGRLPAPVRSRFQSAIFKIENPDLELRQDIIRFYLKGISRLEEQAEAYERLDFFDKWGKSNIIKDIANKTEGLSSREIADMVNLAAEEAVSKNHCHILQEDLEIAKDKIWKNKNESKYQS